MIYMPAERPEFLNDPISAYGDQLLAQWGWDNHHKIFCDADVRPTKCQCGVAVKNDDEIRAHWLERRSAAAAEKRPAVTDQHEPLAPQLKERA